MKRVRSAFVTGILVTVPLIITIQIITWFAGAVEGSVRQYIPTSLLPVDFPGLGLILALVLILLAGALTQNYVGKWLVAFFDNLIKKIPVGGGIYSAVKKFFETVLNPSSDKFKGVVLVEFPRTGVWSLGFRTGTPDSKITRKMKSQLVNVFVPCTPNPTSGFYLLVPADQIVSLDISVQEAFRIVISMGIVTSDDPELLPK